MARFRGTVQGGRGEGSRLGHVSTGLTTRANGWSGRISTRLFVNERDEDWASVHHEDNAGNCKTLYHGPLNKYVPETPWVEVPWKIEPVSLTSEVTHAKE